MSEKEQRQTVVKALRVLDAHSVENRVGPGTPDINYVHGWIETKCLKKWPVRASTPVQLAHDLTQGQRIWLMRRWETGGEAYVLLQAEKDWLIFDAPTACRLIGTATKDELLDGATMVWLGKKLFEQEVAEWLSRRAISRTGSGSSSTGDARH